MIYIYYDKQCSFCSGFINRLKAIQYQKDTILKDSSDLESIQPGEKIDTLVVIRGNEQFIFSDAALELMKLSGRQYKILAKVAELFPKKFRDSIYRIVARNRYNFFGKKSCRLT